MEQLVGWGGRSTLAVLSSGVVPWFQCDVQWTKVFKLEFCTLQPCVGVSSRGGLCSQHLCPAGWGVVGMQDSEGCAVLPDPKPAGIGSGKSLGSAPSTETPTLVWAGAGDSGLLVKNVINVKVSLVVSVEHCIVEVMPCCKRGAAFHTSSTWRTLVTQINEVRSELMRTIYSCLIIKKNFPVNVLF